MRFMMRFIAMIVVVLAGWAAPPPLAQAAKLDKIADHVFGQTDFTQSTANNGGLSANGLYATSGVALDKQGNLYVADTNNNRVLEYDTPLTTDHTADRVFGQTNFISNTANNGGVSASSLNAASGVALDEQGNLYVADSGNNRVLEYAAPLTTDRTADRVFGQPDFTHNNSNNSGVSATSLSYPSSVALDAQGNLYVADSGNSRVLEYDTPLSSGSTADHVFGQPDFTHNITNNGGVSANSLYGPRGGVALDGQGNLYVADTDNYRVLEYDTPLSAGTTADRVFGQPDLTSNAPNNGGLSAISLDLPDGVALDAQGNLYVGDGHNNRVLEYDTPLTTDRTADRVLGQPDFASKSPNNGGVSATSLSTPAGVVLDAQGNLYVADNDNSRVLEYDVPAPYGVPGLAALSPSTVAAGSPAFTLTVNGFGFVPGCSVRWNGSNRPTTYLNSTQLNASISAADLAGGGPFAVTVFTPAPGGGTSSHINLSRYARAGQDATADVVQGQPNFGANSANNPRMPGANRVDGLHGVAVDGQSGRLFVADYLNQRVLSWPNAPAFANGQPADLVLGQPNFLAHSSNNGGLSAKSLSFPAGVALDAQSAQSNLYVADYGNNRVLEYNAPLSSGMAASRVFGQAGSFATGLSNKGGVSANSLFSPAGVALDKHGNLYVADTSNNRVLEYDTPLSAGTTADRVFGQPDLASNASNKGGLSANSLDAAYGVGLDAQGDLYVADNGNNRVLEYDTPLSAGTTADRVFGQPDFTHNSANNGGLSASRLNAPDGVVLDAQGDLYVADSANNRVLEYDTPLSSGTTADRVFGQPDFTHDITNNGGVSANSLYYPFGVALDAQGNLYVADYGNNRVLEYDWALVKLLLPLVVR